MMRRLTSGRITHIDHRTTRMKTAPNSRSFAAERRDRSLKNAARMGMERHKSSSAKTTWVSTAKNRQERGIFGWGVERSRLPHWEQASAGRGFTWSFAER